MAALRIEATPLQYRRRPVGHVGAQMGDSVCAVRLREGVSTTAALCHLYLREPREPVHGTARGDPEGPPEHPLARRPGPAST